MKFSDEILFSEEQIRKRAKELGEEISRDYSGKPIVLIGILKGAVMWLTDIMKEIDTSMEVQIDFMACSSYCGGFKSSGDVVIKKDVGIDIEGKNVIIVEDIIDSGLTLNTLREYLLQRNPESVEFCALLDRPLGRKAPVDVKYRGFLIEDDCFIVGYGLDVAQKYRNLPYITYVESL